MSNTKLETIQFHNQQLIVLNHQNKPYIAMKPVCENIGLDWHAQRQRIHRHHVLSKGEVMITLPSKSGNQEYLCLPISMINGWLFGIETSRVKPEIRATLEQYQLECFDVLYNHFMPKVAQQFPNTINAEQQQQIKQAVNERSYRTGEHYQAIYTKLYEQFKIPRYQDLPASKFDEAIEWLGGVHVKLSQFTNDELCTLAWCYKAAERMRQHIRLVTEAMYQIKSEYAPAFYSMGIEYKSTLENARIILDRETKHINHQQQGYLSNNWNRVLPCIRHHNLIEAV